MPQCPYIVHCPYFSNQARPAQVGGVPYGGLATSIMRSGNTGIALKYCSSTCYYCARYRTAEALGANNVPDDLRPDQVAYAKEIIDKHAGQSLPGG